MRKRFLVLLFLLFVLAPVSALGTRGQDCDAAAMKALLATTSLASAHAQADRAAAPIRNAEFLSDEPCKLPQAASCHLDNPADTPASEIPVAELPRPAHASSEVAPVFIAFVPQLDRLPATAEQRDPPCASTPLFIRHRALLL